MLLTHLPSVTLTFGRLLLVKGHRDAVDLLCTLDSRGLRALVGSVLFALPFPAECPSNVI